MGPRWQWAGPRPRPGRLHRVRRVPLWDRPLRRLVRPHGLRPRRQMRRGRRLGRPARRRGVPGGDHGGLLRLRHHRCPWRRVLGAQRPRPARPANDRQQRPEGRDGHRAPDRLPSGLARRWARPRLRCGGRWRRLLLGQEPRGPAWGELVLRHGQGPTPSEGAHRVRGGHAHLRDDLRREGDLLGYRHGRPAGIRTE